MEKYLELSNLIFPDINLSIVDLEIKYPKRNVEGAVTRFAPSPTGFFHTGSLFSSLIDKRIAEQSNGVFFLRIEDTDKKREVEGSVQILISEMNKFGININEGVVSENREIGKYGPYTQSKREEIYKIVAKELISKGIVYPCFCSSEVLTKDREKQEKNKVRPGYYGDYARCRNISVDEMISKVLNNDKYILRLKSNGSHLKKVVFNDLIRGRIEIAENDQDIVVIKSDNLPTYHFAHAVDDHFMRTTHVIRGEEWISSVPLHIELFNLLNFDLPKYAHLPTVMIQDGISKRKLSKRKDEEAAVGYFLMHGYPVEGILEYILSIINSDYEPWRKNNLTADKFDFKIRLEKMNSAGALFDIDKLNDVCKEYISRLSAKDLLTNILNWSKEYNEEIYEMFTRDLEYSESMLAIERENVKKIRKDLVKYEDVMENYFFFFKDKFNSDVEKESNFEINEKITKEVITNVISKYIEIYNHEDDKETWFSKIKILAGCLDFCTDMKEYKLNAEKYIGSVADIASIIRVAITNRRNTPDIYNIMQVLGKEEVLNRLK